MSAATRRRRSPPKKKSINPLLIAGPLVGILVILVIVILVTGGGDGKGDTPAKPDKTPEQIAAEKERLDKERQKKLEEEKLLSQARLQMEFNKRAAECKTADDFVKLAREAARDDLKSLAEGFYLRALTLDQGNKSAHLGLEHKLFECSRDLENWDMISFGGISEKLTEYTALEGTWVPPLEMERIVTMWKGELPKFTTLVDERQNDPYELKIQFYSKHLKSQPFFGDIALNDAYSIGRGSRPIALFIQEARDRQEGHAEAIEKVYTPFLQALMKHIDEAFLAHFELERNDGFEAYIVWILNSGGAYVDHARDYDRTEGLSVSSRAHYNHQKRLAVTYLEDADGQATEDLHSLAHEMVHYFQDAYAPYGIRAMSTFWLIEGMAEWISTFSGKIPGGPFYFQAKNNGRIGHFISEIDKLDGEWPIPLVALIEIENGIVLASAIAAAISDDPRIAAMGSKADVQSRLTNWVYAFGYCMCRYLHAEHEKEFYKYMAIDMEGDADGETFKRIFGIKDLSKFEKDFVEYFK